MSLFGRSLQDQGNLRIWAEISVFSMIMALSFSTSSWYLLTFGDKTYWLANLTALFAVGYSTYFLTQVVRKRIVNKWHRAALFGAWILLVQTLTLKFLLHPTETISIFKLIANPFISFSFLDIFHAEIWHLFTFLIMIWIGSTFAVQPVDAYRAVAIFQFNIFIFIIYIFSILDINSLLPLFNFFSFVFFSLISLATGRIAQLAYEKGGKLPALQKVWGLGIPAAALFIIGLSVFAGWLSNGSLAPAATA
ncbi:MAG: hypothetical protein HGA53_00820, partial [Anaerolineaceae bacterium]|nr:hypothetical protein [Anaerolineaceae bacterium]